MKKKRRKNIPKKLITSASVAERYMTKYIFSFLLIVVLGMLILASQFHTQAMYRKNIELEKERQSIEAEYNRRKERFRNATLNSTIMEEVKRRKLNIDKSVLPPIPIE